MRRFLIWSALAVVVGLLLAGGGYWAYWNFYARFQPVTITRNQAEIQRLLDEASWVSADGGGRDALYLVTWRDNPAGQRYEREEFAKLRAAGLDARIIVFARADREGMARSTAAERATVAELWLTRDWSLYERWTATPVRNWTAAGILPADGNMARTAVVGAGRDFAERLSALLRSAGAPVGYPLVLWRNREGYLRACACSDARSWAFIRDDVDAPEAVSAEPVEATPQPAGRPLPYPGDASAPAAVPDAAPPSGDAPAETPPAAARAPSISPARNERAPAAPRAQQQDEALFF
jgi:hypothetical protein